MNIIIYEKDVHFTYMADKWITSKVMYCNAVDIKISG